MPSAVPLWRIARWKVPSTRGERSWEKYSKVKSEASGSQPTNSVRKRELKGLVLQPNNQLSFRRYKSDMFHLKRDTTASGRLAKDGHPGCVPSKLANVLRHPVKS